MPLLKESATPWATEGKGEITWCIGYMQECTEEKPCAKKEESEENLISNRNFEWQTYFVLQSYKRKSASLRLLLKKKKKKRNYSVKANKTHLKFYFLYRFNARSHSVWKFRRWKTKQNLCIVLSLFHSKAHVNSYPAKLIYLRARKFFFWHE